MTLDTGKGKAFPRDQRGRSRIVRHSAIALLGLVLAVAACEGLLRFGLGLGNPVLIQSDPACGYTLKPDQDVVRFFARTHINHYGMRSDEVTVAHQAGTLRLLFVGDSITYGTTRVDQNKIFTEVLHRELPPIVHRPVEVLNASAGAWAPDNELSYLESRGTFHADIVFLVLNDGDLTQPRSTIAMVGDDLPQRRPASAISELYSRYIRPRIFHLISKSDAGDSIVEGADEVTRRNLADIERMDVLVTSQGARLILVYIPIRKDIPQESKSAAAIFQAWSANHHVSMFDLTSTEAPYSLLEITFDNGIHLNAKGHLAIARAIEQSWAAVVGSQ
jgi:lysophospholipase L1-like esterase